MLVHTYIQDNLDKRGGKWEKLPREKVTVAVPSSATGQYLHQSYYPIIVCLFKTMHPYVPNACIVSLYCIVSLLLLYFTLHYVTLLYDPGVDSSLRSAAGTKFHRCLPLLVKCTSGPGPRPEPWTAGRRTPDRTRTQPRRATGGRAFNQWHSPFAPPPDSVTNRRMGPNPIRWGVPSGELGRRELSSSSF